MARKRQRTALQAWQKRARDKESRLRARGATPDSVAAISPRVDWGDVRRMSGPEKNSYIAALKRFVSRSNKVTVNERGTALSAATLESSKSAIAKYNARVRRERARIDRIRVDETVPGAGNITTIEQRQRERQLERKGKRGKYHVRGAAQSALYEITEEEPPANQRVAERRNRQFVEMARRSWAEKRERLRESAIEMLERIGDYETADIVENMGTAQFEVLSQRTDFFDELAVAYAPAAGSKASGLTTVEAALQVSLADGDVKGDYHALVDIVTYAVAPGRAPRAMQEGERGNEDGGGRL